MAHNTEVPSDARVGGLDPPRGAGPGVVRPGKVPSPPRGGSDGERRRPAWPASLELLSGAVVFAVVVLDAPMRAVPVLAYIAVVPGLACVRLARVPDRLTAMLLGIGLSFGLGVVVAETMLALHIWSPLLGVATLVAIASVAASTELSRAAP